MAFDENLDQFFDDFAVEAVFALSPSGTRAARVIFNTPSQEVRIYDQSIVTDAPNLTCKTSDLANVSNRSSVTVNGTVYNIGKITDDGTGLSTVYLK